MPSPQSGLLPIFLTGRIPGRSAGSRETPVLRLLAAMAVTLASATFSGGAAADAAGPASPFLRVLATPVIAYRDAAGPRALDSSLVRPLSLASADFDEDGVADLVAAYGAPAGGLLVLHRGKLASIYPGHATAAPPKTADTPWPFLSMANLVSAPEPPDFLAAGDFDADSHLDLVTAARGGRTLYLLPGDGRGGFGPPQRIDVPGAVTALAAGEVNRADGLADLVVGIVGDSGAKALVFESPLGALRGAPEPFALPGEATALALGHLDDDALPDLAVAAGRDLLIVHGRDRKLSLDDVRRSLAPPARVERVSLPFSIASLALGHFASGASLPQDIALLSETGTVHRLTRGNNGAWAVADELATAGVPAERLVRARVTGRPADDLIVVDSRGARLQLLSGAGGVAGALSVASLTLAGTPVAALPMRLNKDALSDLVILREGSVEPTVAVTVPADIFTVDSLGDDPDFDPADSICDDGTGLCTLRAAIEQANASPGADEIDFALPGVGFASILPTSALSTVTEALTIDGTTESFGRVGLRGTNAGAGADGLHITAPSCVVRGLVIGSFGGDGIELTGPPWTGTSIVEGNYIGTSVSGVVNLGNTGNGVYVNGPLNNTIGGTAGAIVSRNIIVANHQRGVIIQSGGAVLGNLVLGNSIGIDRLGGGLGNLGEGVVIGNASGNTVGGPAAGARNLISANGTQGIGLYGLATGNLVQGNLIGTDTGGTAAWSNSGDGVYILDANANTIGGTVVTARNLISANALQGVHIQGSGATTNLVQGNFIGTEVTGSGSLGNFIRGVFIESSANPVGNAVGGAVAGAGNVISGNVNIGVEIAAASGNFVQGNLIGTNAAGTTALPNLAGVKLANAPNNIIGGTAAAARNVISGNSPFEGVMIFGYSSTGNQVAGNRIGTDATGNAPLGNGGAGLRILDANDTTVGVAGGSAPNSIAFNGSAGVQVEGDGVFGGARNSVRGNYFYYNAGLGIDLGGDGVTLNDLGDGDAGPNGRQNFPVLTGLSRTVNGTTIRGVLNSTANTDFSIDFYSSWENASPPCDPSGFGEAWGTFGSTSVTTDGAGNASFAVTIVVPAPAGALLTATATAASGNTSEFSRCLSDDVIFKDGFQTTGLLPTPVRSRRSLVNE